MHLVPPQGMCFSYWEEWIQRKENPHGRETERKAPFQLLTFEVFLSHDLLKSSAGWESFSEIIKGEIFKKRNWYNKWTSKGPTRCFLLVFKRSKQEMATSELHNSIYFRAGANELFLCCEKSCWFFPSVSVGGGTQLRVPKKNSFSHTFKQIQAN